MFLQWLTDGDLGVYSTTQSFSELPLILQYNIEVPPGTVTLVDGSLPPGVSWEATPNYVYITGTPSTSTIPQPYQFTLRLTGIDETYLDQQFTIQMVSSPVPLWISPANTGTYPETYSFNLNPKVLQFAASDSVRITLINGTLPAGLEWKPASQSVVITGESDNISETRTYSWTFRLSSTNGTVADRTFSMVIQPVPQLPSWSNQSQFLGYIGSGQTGNFRVIADGPGTLIPTYQLVAPIPAGLSINAVNGLITYVAPDITADTTIQFTVRALLSDGSADLQAIMSVLTVPHIPVWLNDDETVFVPQGQYLELPLQAFEVTGAPLMYWIYYAPADFPFKVDPEGLLYGKAPLVTENRIWEAVLVASSSNGGAYLYLTVEVTKTNAKGVLTWRNISPVISGAEDGRRACYDIGASSTRTPTVKHGIIGGQCPPGMVLDKIQGCLVGYLDYHAVDKDYWFDITATDGIDTLVRRIHMQVKATIPYQFASLEIPLWGDLKQRWLATNNYVMTNPNMTPNVATQSNFYSVPSMSLIKGLDSTILDPEEILDDVRPTLQELRLNIGSISNVIVDSQHNNLIFRNVIDPGSGAASTADHNGLPEVIYPANLENLRKAFAGACGFANGGLGHGAVAVATIDPERGEVTSVTVIESGDAYVYRPDVKIVGSGSGATAEAIMQVVNVTIVDPGYGWELGESIYLEMGRSDAVAELVVSAVTNTGGLVDLLLVDGGKYSQVPIGKRFIFNAAGGPASLTIHLGVRDIEITNRGSGYVNGDTSVIIGGTELLEPWENAWSPRIPMALVTPRLTDTVLYNSRLSVQWILDGSIWQVGDLIHSIEGLYWQGSTAFDQDLVSLDGDTTCFEETLEPRETLLDQGDCTFDLADTTLDHGPTIRPDARANWGNTLIDDGLTAFEFYATIFDAKAAPTESTTKVRRLIRTWKPQISGNNITDTR